MASRRRNNPGASPRQNGKTFSHSSSQHQSPNKRQSDRYPQPQPAVQPNTMQQGNSTLRSACSWDKQNVSTFNSLRAQMLNALASHGQSASGKTSANTYARSLSASAASIKPSKDFLRAKSTQFPTATASDADTTPLMDLLPNNENYFDKAAQYLFDTPLPFTIPNNNRSTMNSHEINSNEKETIHLRQPQTNESIYLLPRPYLRTFIEYARSSIVNSAIQHFLCEHDSNPHPVLGNSRTFRLDIETLRTLAAYSVISQQYSLFEDDSWGRWFVSLEKRWRRYQENVFDEKKDEDGENGGAGSSFLSVVPPGAVDARLLCRRGHPLLLRRDVALMMGGLDVDEESTVLSVNDEIREETLIQFIAGGQNGSGEDKPRLAMCPVSSSFYEFIRSTLGVICEDGTSISFQPSKAQSGEETILHHEQYSTVALSNKNGKDVDIPHPSYAPQQSVEPASPSRRQIPRPIEFQRRILTTSYIKKHDVGTPTNAASPNKKMSSYSKLMKEAMTSRKEEGHPVEEIKSCSVEVHPVEFKYVVVDPTYSGTSVNKESKSTYSANGVALVSRVARLSDAFNDFRRTVVQNRSSACVRLWSKSPCGGSTSQRGATASGDGYDLIDDSLLDGSDEDLTVEKGLRLEDRNVNVPAVVEILVEIRSSPSSRWVREPLELENRLQVGDYVDAQDSALKWYEAIVREIKTDTVKVHFFGWGSRWDAEVPRQKGGAKKVSPPMPLWSKTSGWRYRIKAGQEVEVRQTASPAYRPKWYRATVIAVRRESDAPIEIVGGAELEQIGEDNKSPLKLLNRKRQVLVRVVQEKNNCTTPPPEKLIQDNGLPVVHPPYIRWIDLYGEEICEANTHIKFKKQSDAPATVTYAMDSQRTQPVEVMKPFNNLHGAGFVRESLRGVPPAPGSVGLHNLGNSCYMNSILQCVNHISPITQYFLKGDYAKHINKNNPLGSGGRVATAYASFLSEIWTGEYSILAPRTLKQTVGFFAPQFNNNYQHDSQEFCQYLMDGLHEDLNKVIEKPYVEHIEANGMKDDEAALESWKRHLLRHDSVFVDYTQGMHRSHLTCPSCGKESIKFDVYSSISLPLVPSKDRPSIPLKDCLDQFAAGEQLDEHNAWYCSRCKKHVCALKLITLWNTPDILVLHLKRFTFEKCPRHDGRLLRSKIEDKVDFPIDRLDLSSYILGPIHADAPPVYKLFGVSEHTGSTANSGHYTATVRNSKDGNWYRYNDSHVGSTSGDAAVTGGAYLLFYQREKGSLRWAGMERQMQNVPDMDGFTEVQGKRKKK